MNDEAREQIVVLLAHLVRERSGLSYTDKDRNLFLSKVEAHAGDHGFESLLDYYYALRYDDPSADRTGDLVDALVVGETYFFRERGGLEAVVERVRERALEGLGSRIWCAACATGEEPVSLAILLARADLLDKAQIVASDVSRRQVRRARAGEHTHRALRVCQEGMPPWLEVIAGVPHVAASVRERIEWRIVNLVNEEEVRELGAFDVILCRNVLIYFDDPTVTRVTASLARNLEPEGFLLIGASESLMRFGTLLTCTERNGAFVYIRSTP